MSPQSEALMAVLSAATIRLTKEELLHAAKLDLIDFVLRDGNSVPHYRSRPIQLVTVEGEAT